MPFRVKIKFLPTNWLTAIAFMVVLLILPILSIAAPKTITFSSNNPAVPAADLNVPSTKQAIYRAVFTLSGTGSGLTSVTFTPTGTFVANDISNYEFYWNTTDNLASATSNQPATTVLGAGNQVTINIYNPWFNDATTYYCWITADISSSADTDNGHTITVGALTSNDFDFTQNVSASGTMYYGGTQTLVSTDPNIIVSPTSLNGFAYIEGNGPSTAQSYTVRGTKLTGNVILTAPAHYEISTSSGSGYTNSLTLNQSGGLLVSTIIYVRLKAGYPIGTYNAENITHNSTGANTKNVSCNGQVTCNLSPPTVTSPLYYCQNAIATTLTATGQNLSWLTSGSSSVGGNTNPSKREYIQVSNNHYTYFTVNGNISTVDINSIDWYLPKNQTVSNVQIAIQHADGSAVTNGIQSNAAITLSSVGYGRKITSTFSNLTLNPGNYRFALFAGSGQFGYFNNLTYPQTEPSTSIDITGYAGNNHFYNLQFSYQNQSTTAPTPITTVIGTTYYYVTQTVSGCTSGPASIEVTVSATCNSITTGTVTLLSFCVGAHGGVTGSVAFTSSGTYNTNFNAILSDQNGSFTGASIIGTLAVNGTDPSGNIPITIPEGKTAGTGYKIRIDCTTPAVTGTQSTAFEIQSINNVSTPSAVGGTTSATLSWTNPVNCVDEIMVVAKTAAITGTPSGDGSAYTANSTFESGTSFDGGFVVYKGISSPQTVSNLANGTPYFFKIFTREGSSWSTGITVNATTAAVTAPTVTTGSASGITNTGAVLNGTMNAANGAATTITFDYGSTLAYGTNAGGSNSPTTSTATNVSSAYTITSGLTANTLYNFRINGENTFGTTNGNNATFTTLPGQPSTAAASAITSTGFRANWTAPSQGSEAFTYTLEYGTDNTFASTTTLTGISALFADISGLSPTTTYYYRVKCNNTTGDGAYSATYATVTTAAIAPTVSTQAVSAIATTTATANGTITSTGGSTTSWVSGICWDTSTGPTTANNTTTDGPSTLSAYTGSLTGLTANTEYFVNAYATNNFGTSYGSEVNFTTLSLPPTVGTGSGETYSGFTANWTVPGAQGSEAFTYTVEVSTANGAGFDVGIVGGSTVSGISSATTSQAITGLSGSTTYYYRVKAGNAGGNNASAISGNITTLAGCTATGTILKEQWDEIAGNPIINLTGDASYPETPSSFTQLTSFEIPTNAADTYGVRIRGYICAPTTGDYTFWTAADDQSELWLSTDDNPANITMIANNTLWTGSRQWYDYPSQQSTPIALVAGQQYYIEALMKEGGGGDNLAVGWVKPSDVDKTTASEVIPGSVLSPFIEPVTSVSVSPTNAWVAIGNTTTITETVGPNNAADKTVTWSSSDDLIATVDASGVVTGVAVGSVTITATTNDGGYTDNSTVTVTLVPTCILSQPIDATICGTETTTSFSITTTGGTGFQWQYNTGGGWTNITGAVGGHPTYANFTSTTLNLSNITNAHGGFQYRCEVNAGCTATSDAVSLTTEIDIYTPTLSAASYLLDAGQSTTMYLTNSQLGVDYQLSAITSINPVVLSPIGSALPGINGTLSFPTGNLSNSTNYTVEVSSQASGCIDTIVDQRTITVNEDGLIIDLNPCAGQPGANFFTNSVFGTTTTNIGPLQPSRAVEGIWGNNIDAYTDYIFGFDGTEQVNDNYYVITNSTNGLYTGTWIDTYDNTEADGTGHMFVVNADYNPGIFYSETITGLCDSTKYEFSADVINLFETNYVPYGTDTENWFPDDDQGNKYTILPNIDFIINGKVALNTGNIMNSGGWSGSSTFGFTFRTGGLSSITLTMRNNAPGGIGNDIALDNIVMRACGPEINLQIITSLPVCPGTPVTMTANIIASDFNSPVYQWQTSTDDGTTWTNISGATTTVYTENAPVNGHQFRYITAETIDALNDPLCHVAANPIIIITDAGIESTSDNFVCNSGDVILSATAIAGNTITWYDAPTGGNVLKLNDPTPSSYTATSISVTDTFYVDATDGGSCTSSPREMVIASVIPSPLAATADAAIYISCDQFTAVWDSLPYITTYYLDVDDNSDFSSLIYANINVGSDTTYTVTGLASGTTYYYRVSAENICGTSAESNTITTSTTTTDVVSVSIAAAPSETVVVGTSVTFTATPTNGGPSPSYQWQVDYGSGFVNVGTDSPTFTSSTLNDGDVVSCILTSSLNPACISGDPATSIPTTMTILPPGLTISGFVFNDLNGMTGTNKVDGSPISTADGNQLYAVLIDQTAGADTVYAAVAISAGAYTFSTVTIGLNLDVLITTTNYSVGDVSPSASLPALWEFTGAIDNDASNTVTGSTLAADTTLGLGAVSVNLDYLNFGIRKNLPPLAYNDTINANTNQIVTYNIINDSPFLSNRDSDPEDDLLNNSIDLDISTTGSRETSRINYNDANWSVDDNGLLTVQSTINACDTLVLDYTIKDGFGNMDTATIYVALIDVINPVISFAEDTLIFYSYSGLDSTLTIPQPTALPNTLSDNCSATASNDFNATDNATGTYSVGETLVKWTAIDPSGNSAPDSQLVVFAAMSGIAITCPPDSNYGCISALPGTNPSVASTTQSGPWVFISLTDDYPGVASGDACDSVRTVTYTALWKAHGLGAGKTKSCQQTIYFRVDAIDPVITCRTDTTVTTNSGCYYIVPDTRMDATAFSDNCEIDSIYNDFDNTNTLFGKSIPIGMNTIQWIAVDSCGNRDTCSFVLTVNNNYLPEITVQPSAPAAFCDGAGSANISVTTDGSGSRSYQWYNGSTALSEAAPYTNVDLSTLTITSPDVSLDGYEYHVVITDDVCLSTVNSDTIAITVEPLPIATYTMSDVDNCRFATTTLTLSNSEDNVDYQLRDDSDDSTVGSPVTGSTGSSIEFINLMPTDTTIYNVLATSTTGSGCSLELLDKATINVLFFNALVRDITESTDSNALIPLTFSSSHCPDLIAPDFEPENGAYNAGASIVDFRVERDSSMANWEFDYSISGGTVVWDSIRGDVTGGITHLNTSPDIYVNATSNNYVYFRFKITNTPGAQQDIVFTVKKVNETTNPSCPESGNTSDNTKTHIIEEMPDVGSFN